MNNINSNNNNIKLNLEHNSLDGGEAIASGGFGCVFKPALRCKNGARPKNKVTKLMSTRHAIKEYEFIQSVKSQLKSIPNYHDYFLVDDFELCEPASLTEEDAKNFEEKCSALKKTSKKSNSKKSNGKKSSKKSKNRSRSKMSVDYLKKHLDDVRALNMPDGGVDLEVFLKTSHSKKDLIELNNALIELLLNGIVPMNKKHIYHCDIKDTNMLVENEDKLNVRLIDWGLSVLELEDRHKIPSNLNRRPFQYNVPFSSILFNTHFVEMYADFLKKTPSPSETELRTFTMNYILFWNEERGEGHIKTIHRIIETLVKDETLKKVKIKDNHFAYYYIIDYIVKILQSFTKNGVFHIMDYFNSVFMKNIDIWGFIMTYMAFIEELEKIDSPLYHKFLKKIKNIVFEFLYDSPTKPMNIEKLVVLLKDLNKIDTQQGGTKKIKKMKNKTRKLKYK